MNQLQHSSLFLLFLFLQLTSSTQGEIYDLSMKDDYDPNHLAPVWIRESPMNEATVQVFPDGKIKLYHAPNRYSKQVMSMESTDGGVTWSNSKLEFEVEGIVQYPRRTLIDKNGDVHILVFARPNPQERNVYHAKTIEGKWGPMTKAADGQIGAIRGFIQTRSGRLVYTFHRVLRNRKPPLGSSSTSAVFSDDLGKTWTQSTSWVTAPCRADFNGNNYGCVEPNVIQLKDGRLWILCRTQTGYLYQSFSSDEGETWSKGQPSIFRSSNSPANLLRLPDGQLVLTWCNTNETDLKTFGRIYTHRDVLHMAISEDDGRTWRGFREVFRIPTRNNQTKLGRGDSGTSYPNTAMTKQGKIILVTGQGERGGGRAILLVDSRWFNETEHEDDFSAGLEKWSCYTFTDIRQKPARTLGPKLLDDVAAAGGKVLHLRKHLAKQRGDGAVWNFPLGRAGTLEMRIRVNPGSYGTTLMLTDHHRHPSDPGGEKTAMFLTHVGTEDGLPLQPNRWHTVALQWDLKSERCTVTVDGKESRTLELQNPTRSGISYVRFRSMARRAEVDTAGLLVDYVKARVTLPDSLPTRDK